MGSVATLPVAGVFTGSQLALIRRTVANDCNDSEFDLFVTVARNAGLDPFRKQISALVFNKAKADKRRMAIVTTIDGLRVIASRSGRYRPDEEEARYEYDPELKGPTNPLGLVKASVKIWIADTAREGGWRPVMGVAYWDEFAPISDEWGEDPETGRRRPTGKKTLDTGGNWSRMPRVMLAKCAEAQALRKAFPEDLSALYAPEELDQAQASDLSPSEVLSAAQTEDRLSRIGTGVTFQLTPNGPLEPIALGQIADRVLATARDFTTYAQIQWFDSANTYPLREFWARAPGDALAVKKELEAIRARLLSEAQDPA